MGSRKISENNCYKIPFSGLSGSSDVNMCLVNRRWKNILFVLNVSKSQSVWSWLESHWVHQIAPFITEWTGTFFSSKGTLCSLGLSKKRFKFLAKTFDSRPVTKNSGVVIITISDVLVLRFSSLLVCTEVKDVSRSMAAAALHLVPIRRPVSQVTYHIWTNGMLGLVTHTDTHTQSLALFGSRRLHVPSESNVGGQQVAHADHTRHYHHGEAEPVRSNETSESRHLPSVIFTYINTRIWAEMAVKLKCSVSSQKRNVFKTHLKNNAEGQTLLWLRFNWLRGLNAMITWPQE